MVKMAEARVDLTPQDIKELQDCVRFYQRMHISITSHRYVEYNQLLKKLEQFHRPDNLHLS